MTRQLAPVRRRLRMACSNEGREVWCWNLGAAEKVAEVMSQWVPSYDDGEMA